MTSCRLEHCGDQGSSQLRPHGRVAPTGHERALPVHGRGGRQVEAGLGSARTFRRKTAWRWRVEPAITITGEIYDEVLRTRRGGSR